MFCSPLKVVNVLKRPYKYDYAAAQNRGRYITRALRYYCCT